ncbi:MAG TPA: serine/threonine-protein kinase [Gemmatimonadaceae bacterium]|nr:serine/threonine-protein kinase [Gemmatimonadaceae bacterium]
MTDGGPPAATLAAGTLVAGRYRVAGEVGRGGMATVYRATDTQAGGADVMGGGEVAVKVLRPDLAAMIGAERFAREVRITAQLVHPNIVPILDSGSHDGLPFYVMPLIVGEPLDARIRREQMLGVDEAVRIAIAVANALAYAHGLGFVHRDVKPSNVLLAGDQVWLGDFGIARAMTLSGSESITDSGIALGTAKYMSPEQAAGGSVDARADVYSLACVLFEALAGAPPFAGPAQAVLARHALDTAPSLLTIRPSITPALDREIQRALATVPGDRHAGAREFADAIAAARTDTRPATAFATGVARPPAPATTRTRPTTFHVAWVAAAVTALAAGGAWYAARGRAPLDERRVIVFPLAAPEGAGLAPSAGEDVATIVGSALGGAPPLHAVDGWTALDPRQRDQIRGISVRELRDMARAQRAGYFTMGRFVTRGDSIDVALALYSVAGDSLVAERTATGGRADPWRQAVRAMNALLPALIPNAARDIQADWLARPPAAIASFLQGEAAFRRADPGTALDHYARALHADSSFALAAFRGAQASSWLHDPARGAARGIALLDSVSGVPLPPRFAAFAAGLRAYLTGDGDAAVAAFRRAVAADPEFAEAWTQLGESYTHLMPAGGRSDARADSAFRTAHALDPSAANVLFHLIEVRLRERDAAGARPLLAAYRAANADTAYLRQFDQMLRCVERGGDAGAWHNDARSAPQALLNASIALAAGDDPPRCAWDMLTAILEVDTAQSGNADNRRYFALVGRVSMLLNAGRTDLATAEVDRFMQRWGYGTSLFLMNRLREPALAARARAVFATDSAPVPPLYLKPRPTTRLWMLAGVALADGRATTASAVRAFIARRADSTHAARDVLAARSLDGRLALAAGDTARALAAFEALVRVPVPPDTARWGDGMTVPDDRLTLAHLYLARGAYDRAIATAETLASPWSPFLAAYHADALDVCRLAADGKGDAAAGRQYAARLDAVRRAYRTAAQ